MRGVRGVRADVAEGIGRAPGGVVEAIGTVLVIQEWHPVINEVIPAARAVVADEMGIGFLGINMIGAGWCQVGGQVGHAGDDGIVVDFGRAIAGPHVPLTDADQDQLVEGIAGALVDGDWFGSRALGHGRG